MQADVLTKRLKPLLRSATTIAKPNDNRPILRNVLLTTTEEGLEITATDTITGLWLRVPIKDPDPPEPEPEEEKAESSMEEID